MQKCSKKLTDERSARSHTTLVGEEEGGTNTTTLLCERLGLATATDFFCCASCLRLSSGASRSSAEPSSLGVY